MYDFIFYFFFRYFLSRNSSIPRYNAVLTVFLTVVIHLFCFLSVVKHYTQLHLPRFSEDYFTNKLLSMPFVLLLILFFQLAYNKNKTDRILNSRKSSGEIFSLQNLVLVFIIEVVPLLTGIFFLRK